MAGLIIGGFVCAQFMNDTTKLKADIANIQTVSEFQLEESKGLAPAKFSSKEFLLSWPGLVMMIGGGFLIGFGSRYAGGCTSGHAIMGLSNLQLASLLSVVGFFIGGLIMVHFLLPLILK